MLSFPGGEHTEHLPCADQTRVTTSSPGYLISQALGSFLLWQRCLSPSPGWSPASSWWQLFVLGQGSQGWDPVQSSVSPTHLRTVARLQNPPGSTSSFLLPAC